jgi:hypothetical protein
MTLDATFSKTCSNIFIKYHYFFEKKFPTFFYSSSTSSGNRGQRCAAVARGAAGPTGREQGRDHTGNAVVDSRWRPSVGGREHVRERTWARVRMWNPKDLL